MSSRAFFQMPLPAVTYCPELNRTLLIQHVECRLREQCDGLNNSQILTNINALKSGCQICKNMEAELQQIENEYNRELIREDLANNTYIDYLRNFLDSSIINQQSFCLSNREDLRIVENLLLQGFCYTINGLKGIFDEKT